MDDMCLNLSFTSPSKLAHSPYTEAFVDALMAPRGLAQPKRRESAPSTAILGKYSNICIVMHKEDVYSPWNCAL